MRCSVYGLAGEDGKVRYIGQTRCRNIKRRLGWHWRDAKRYPNRPLYRWMRKVGKVQIILLNDNCTWDETEMAIVRAFKKNYPGVLLNVDCGDGRWPRRKV